MKRLAALLLVSTLSGCAGLSAADRAPRTDPIARLTTAEPSPWTEDLGDPALRQLLARADVGALDTKLALARLARARGELEAAEAAGRVRVTIGAAAALGGTRRTTQSAATPTFEGAYDIDLWHRFARGRKAAREDQKAAEWDVTAARLMVGAETVRAWAALQTAREAETSALRRRAIATSMLALTRRRISDGAAVASDIDPAVHATAAAEATVEQARSEITLQTARLRDLTGDQALVSPGASPPARLDAKTSTSSASVDNRPDVQAALALLSAADHRRTAAVLASRPQFQIAAAIGAPDAAIATLLDVRALAWAVAGTVAREVLDGGARRAHVHIATVDADLADLAYRKAVLNGWAEIRGALAGEANAGRRLALAETDLASTRAARNTGDTRHAAGVVDGLAIAALAERVEAATDMVGQARLAAVEARVQRTLATGGR